MLIETAFAATAEKTTTALGYSEIAWKIFVALNVVVVTVIVGSLLSRWIRRKLEAKQGDRHRELVILYSRITFTTVFLVGTMIALSMAGIPLQWFSGAIGLGLGLALQGPVGNFVAGITLLSNDKFNLGDFIEVNNTKGTIVDIQSRVTTLRGVDGTEINIPNLDLLTNKVICYTKNPVRRIDFRIGVGYGTNIKKAQELILKAIKTNPAVEPEPNSAVLVAEIGESAIVLEIRAWVESHSKWWEVKSELTHVAFDALQSAGIEIPYPVRTLHSETQHPTVPQTNNTKAAAVFEKVPSEQ